VPRLRRLRVLAAFQQFLPELEVAGEKSRHHLLHSAAHRGYPLLRGQLRIHSIHGRASAVATGLPRPRPDLSVRGVTGEATRCRSAATT